MSRAYRVGLEAPARARHRRAGGMLLLAIAIGLITGVLANVVAPSVVVVTL